MLLYYGSNTDIKSISLAMCRPYKYFGRGFYLTEPKTKQQKWLRGLQRFMEAIL